MAGGARVSQSRSRRAGAKAGARKVAKGTRTVATGARKPAGRTPRKAIGKPRRAPRGRAKAKGRKQGPEAVQAHFRRFPPQRREPMLRLWAIVQDALPGSTSLVSYGIAIAAVGGRRVVGVGAGKAHVGLYFMSPAFVQQNAADLKGLDVSGGTARFPLDKPLPAPLIRRLVRARLVSLGQEYGADVARMKPPRLTEKRAPAPQPTPIDHFPKPMMVPLDDSPKP